MQLSRKEQVAVTEKALEIAATVTGEKERLLGEKDRQLQLLFSQITSLEVSLAQKEEVGQWACRG